MAQNHALTAPTDCSSFLLSVLAPEIASCLEHVLCLTAHT